MKKLLFVFGGLLVSSAFAGEPSGVVGVWAVTFDGFETEGCSIVCRTGTLYLRVPTRGLLMIVR